MNAKELETELRRQAREIKAEPPLGMERRIGAAVRSAEAAHEAADAAAGIWLPRLTLAGAAAAALAIVGFLGYRQAARPLSNPAALAADSKELAQLVSTAPAHLWAAAEPRAATALQEEPLHQEAAALQTDARSALGFLAYNFLPAQG